MRIHRTEFAIQSDTWADQDKCRSCDVNRVTFPTHIHMASACVMCDDAPEWLIDDGDSQPLTFGV